MDEAEIKAAICEEVACGTPLKTACEAEGFPCYKTIYRWARRDPEGFGKQLQAARVEAIKLLQDEHRQLLSKLDTAKREDVPALQTKANALQWMLEKGMRNVYGQQPATLVQNNVMNVVCSEKERAALIEQRERLMSGKPAKSMTPLVREGRDSGDLLGQ